ncbi:MAG: CysB family HTH-type transcriptional regulator [Cytophagales bacterium]|nr:CysB family HTH-type transcriptional regulator [Cytophagales bacterium]
MNLHQLQFVREVARRGLNLTEAAKALHTSQPGVSKSILELEAELGIDIFVRHGKRIKALTEAGQEVLRRVEVIMHELGNLRRIGEHYTAQDRGTLSIATTHTQAQYVLPAAIAQLREEFPLVNISLHQGAPHQVAQMLIDEVAEIGIATEALSEYSELITLPCYDWEHVLVMPKGHPLAAQKLISLKDLAAQPLITYHPSFTGRTKIDSAFNKAKLHPRIALEAIDSDVIKTYVKTGLGVGILAEMAIKTEQNSTTNSDLQMRTAGHLFGKNTTRIAFKKGAYLRNFVYAFAWHLSPTLTRELILKTMKS